MKVTESLEIEGDAIVLGKIYASDGSVGLAGQALGISSDGRMAYLAVGNVITIVATEDIPAFSVVTSTGKIANSANPAHFGKLIGLNPSLIVDGFSGNIVKNGEITNPAWNWIRGDMIFLNGTTLSTSAPATGFAQYIGTAKSPTTIVVELGIPINL